MIQRRSYTPEFRLNAVHLVLNEHRRASEVASELDIPVKTLSHWCFLHQHGKLPEQQTETGSSLTPEQMENSRLFHFRSPKTGLAPHDHAIRLQKKFHRPLA